MIIVALGIVIVIFVLALCCMGIYCHIKFYDTIMGLD